MQYLILIFIFLILNIEKIKTESINDYLKDIDLYYYEICSHNGIPRFDEETKKIICECEEKYANEPREKYKKYIGEHFVQCSYEKKKRFLTFFLAAISPLGIDLLYLEQYKYFALILTLFGLTVFFTVLSFILSYKIQKKKEEEKRKNKVIKSKMKYNIRAELKKITEINDTCVKAIHIVSSILITMMVLYWITSLVAHSFGFIKDRYHIETENDLNYMFESPED